jgi:hypothetical protein
MYVEDAFLLPLFILGGSLAHTKIAPCDCQAVPPQGVAAPGVQAQAAVAPGNQPQAVPELHISQVLRGREEGIEMGNFADSVGPAALARRDGEPKAVHHLTYQSWVIPDPRARPLWLRLKPAQEVYVRLEARQMLWIWFGGAQAGYAAPNQRVWLQRHDDLDTQTDGEFAGLMIGPGKPWWKQVISVQSGWLHICGGQNPTAVVPNVGRVILVPAQPEGQAGAVIQSEGSVTGAHRAAAWVGRAGRTQAVTRRWAASVGQARVVTRR